MYVLWEGLWSCPEGGSERSCKHSCGDAGDDAGMVMDRDGDDGDGVMVVTMMMVTMMMVIMMGVVMLRLWWIV